MPKSPIARKEAATVSVIVLAAGASTRMGAPKQLVRWRGKTMLQHVLDATARSSADEVILVLGAHAEEVAASVEPPSVLKIVINEQFAHGQATSLQKGLQTATGAAAIIVLGDQPELKEETIDLVASRWRTAGSAIVRCVYAGSPGHPILLSRKIWTKLPPEGDTGARPLIERRHDLVDDIDVPHPAPADVNTPRDLKRLVAGS